jgi:hypothetical protein
MIDSDKEPRESKSPERSDPFARRPMTHSFAGFLDSIIHTSASEAERRLAWLRRRLKQARSDPPRSPRR